MSRSSTILVAGGAGYIGSHTAKALHKAGILPVVLDNLCTGNLNAVRFGPFYEGSISDPSLVARIIEDHKPAAAILFAGHAYVGESTRDPRKYFRNNVSEAILFLDSLLNTGVRRVLFSSSCSIYGSQEQIPIGENSKMEPLSPYAETKLFVEKVLQWYWRAYGLNYACLRYFNAAGADPEGELGEQHDPETHLIPLAVEAAIGGDALTVFGTDYCTPDGTAIRDFTHVTDLADAHLRALQYLMEDRTPLTLNLGTGRGYSVREVVQAVEQHLGLPVPIKYHTRRTGDAAILIADPSLAWRTLGWRPVYSSIETIVSTACAWHTGIEGTLSPKARYVADGT
jgi:UDP-arabinose 4-epimerase